jgi:hypothetical protein
MALAFTRLRGQPWRFLTPGSTAKGGGRSFAARSDPSAAVVFACNVAPQLELQTGNRELPRKVRTAAADRARRKVTPLTILSELRQANPAALPNSPQPGGSAKAMLPERRDLCRPRLHAARRQTPHRRTP